MNVRNKLTSEWIERSKNVFAQGFPGTNSKRWTQFIQNIYPSHTHGHGIGPYLYDFCGTKYLDFMAGLGAISLGYNNSKVVEAVKRQVDKGCIHSLPTTLAVEVAEMISAIIPSAEKVRFLKNGDDAARAAIRISRTYNDRSIILCDGYHGHSDIFSSLSEPALGIKDSFQIFPLKENPNLGNVSAVIVEALKLDMSDEYRIWLTNLRQECKKTGTLFILDEIVTGFRVPEFTIANLWHLEPDIILLGKGIANGWPLSVVAGKKEIMDCGNYFISTTFSEDACSLAACKATLQEIQIKNLKDLLYYGKRLQDRLNQLHPDIKWEGWGTRAMLNVTNETTALFMQEMCKAGFLFGKAHFFNFSHLEANIENIVMNMAEAVVDRIKQGQVQLEGKMPEETFKR